MSYAIQPAPAAPVVPPVLQPPTPVMGAPPAAAAPPAGGPRAPLVIPVPAQVRAGAPAPPANPVPAPRILPLPAPVMAAPGVAPPAAPAVAPLPAPAAVPLAVPAVAPLPAPIMLTMMTTLPAAAPLGTTLSPLLENKFLGWTSGVLHIGNVGLLIFVLILIFIAILMTCGLLVYLIRCCCKSGEKHQAPYQKMPSLYVDQLPGYGLDADAQTFGMLEYSLEYNMKASELRVGIIQVMDLFLNAATEQMDVYVKVTLKYDESEDAPTKKKSEKPKIFTTEVKRDCISAAFNEEFAFKVAYNQLKNTTIRMVAYDFDAYAKDTVIGEVAVMLKDLPMENYVGKDYEGTGYLLASTGAGEDHGQLCIVLTNMPKEEELHVNVLEARQLNLQQHSKKYPDTLVSATLHIGKKKLANKKTTARSNTVNPYFGELLVFNVKQEKLIVANLTLSVKHKSHAGVMKSLGKVMLGSTVSEASSHKQWTEMLTDPKRPIAMWHSIYVKEEMVLK